MTTVSAPTTTSSAPSRRVGPDWPFYLGLGILSGVYVVLIVGMLFAQSSFTSPNHVWSVLKSEEVRAAVYLSLISCSATAILSVWVAVPFGYLLSRHRFRGKVLLDALLDIPIVLPPLVIGLGLLILFQTKIGRGIEDGFRIPGTSLHTPGIPFTFTKAGVVLAQFMVACAFAVRTMRVTFDQINPRQELVALTLGCTRGQAFWSVVLPQARRGIITAATLAWARSLGEFGPILIFAGATRMRTEVLPTTVFLELSYGNIEAAAAVSILMIVAAGIVLAIVRIFGLREDSSKGKVI